MSNWQGQSITQAAESVWKAMQENLRSEHVLAKALNKLKSALDDGEFVRFLMDCESGLGIAQATAYKFERMVSAVDVVPTEKVWEKVGWEGVSKIVKIETRNERVAVCRAVVREDRTVGKGILNEILADKAPSYSARIGVRGPIGGITKTRAVRELNVLKETMSRLLKDYPVLRSDLPEEVEIILGLDRDRVQEAG